MTGNVQESITASLRTAQTQIKEAAWELIMSSRPGDREMALSLAGQVAALESVISAIRAEKVTPRQLKEVVNG